MKHFMLRQLNKIIYRFLNYLIFKIQISNNWGTTPENSFPLGDSHKLDLETSYIKRWE